MKFILVRARFLLISLILISSSALADPIQFPTNSLEEISRTRYVTGGILGLAPGFGLGHAIQGRFQDRGWIFTVGELSSLGLAMWAAEDPGCVWGSKFSDGSCDKGVDIVVLGMGGYIVFHVWEMFDIWMNVPVRQEPKLQGFLLPTRDGGKFVMQYSF